MVRDSTAITFGALVLPTERWPDLVERWKRLDEGGLDSIWSCDHFTNPHDPGAPWFEGSVSLTGLAQATSRARVGLLVGAPASRPPTLFAMQAQAIDHLSSGRLTVGLGAGGAPTDQAMWGVPVWSAAERVSRFAEYVELVDRLLRDDTVDFAGHWYRTEQARTAPGCIQSPRPPLLLAAHGPISLRVAARFADIWNTFGPTLDAALKSSRLLDGLSEDAGRDPRDITRSILFGIREDTGWRTAADFAELVLRWYEAGFRDFIFYDPPYAGSGVPAASPELVNELLNDTIPQLRTELG